MDFEIYIIKFKQTVIGNHVSKIVSNWQGRATRSGFVVTYPGTTLHAFFKILKSVAKLRSFAVCKHSFLR